MAKVVVLGVTGEKGLWLVDIAAGTVTPVQVPASGDLAAAVKQRDAGGVFIKNVDFAIAVSSADTVFSGHVDG
ncbi:hypothetical protein LVY75_00770 (plasmid) [Sinorhizobium sp. B11]|jgi:hypothetical protein|uniref:Uncharacterized protein n=1 Tax=Rhizobium viscosum TaxID=1673 RepID=A0ABR9J0D5_RHIVS|nr:MULTISPECIES: hypothetical protein [Rhizobium]EJJ30044.1 hypothetical protein PMI11_01710 [Rhizobium sp. CF142]MBB3445181.1 hypothetical protein [Rhizobium sp. BK379]MBE1508933.1 hypothetical protein [Rhizobium viscosum]